MTTHPDIDTTLPGSSTVDEVTERFYSTEVTSLQSTVLPGTTEDPNPGDGGKVGAIVGGVIGLIVVVAIVVVLVYILVKKRDRLLKLCMKDPDGHNPPSMDQVDKSQQQEALNDNPVHLSPMKDIEKNDQAKSAPSHSRPYETTQFQPHGSKAELLGQTSSTDNISVNESVRTGLNNNRQSNQSSNSRHTGSNHSSNFEDNIYSNQVLDEVSENIDKRYKPPHYPSKAGSIHSNKLNHNQVNTRESEGIFDDIYDYPKTEQHHDIGYGDGPCDSTSLELAPGVQPNKHQPLNDDEGEFDEIYDHPKSGQHLYQTEEACDSIPSEQAPGKIDSNQQGSFDDIYDSPKGTAVDYDGEICESIPQDEAPRIPQQVLYGVEQASGKINSNQQGSFDEIYDSPKGTAVDYDADICESIPQDEAPRIPQQVWNGVEQASGKINSNQQGSFDEIYDSPKGTSVDYDAEICESIPQDEAPRIPQQVLNGAKYDDDDNDEYDVPPSIHRNKTVPSNRQTPNTANLQSVPQAQTLPVGIQPPPSHRQLTKEPSYTNFQAVQSYKESQNSNVPKPHPRKASGTYVNYPNKVEYNP